MIPKTLTPVKRLIKNLSPLLVSNGYKDVHLFLLLGEFYNKENIEKNTKFYNNESFKKLSKYSLSVIYMCVNDKEKSKLYSQFFTSSVVIEKVYNHIDDYIYNGLSILDPCAGFGDLFKPFINDGRVRGINAIEIDYTLVSMSSYFYGDTKIKYTNKDFFKCNTISLRNIKNKMIVVNPPFKRKRRKCGLYTGTELDFVSTCLSLLNVGDMMIFVLPYKYLRNGNKECENNLKKQMSI